MSRNVRTNTHKKWAVTAAMAVILAVPMLVWAPWASANTVLPGDGDLFRFVTASTPQWNFARANRRDTCWPAAAITANGAQNPGADLKAFPTAGQGGCPARGSSFPTYYSVKQCSDTETRVAFTIYFPKDGFSGNVPIVKADLGHQHDFEQVVLVWTKAAGRAWARDHLLLGRHGEHVRQDWDSAESWDAGRTTAGLGLEFPRIFVGWAKHAMFNHQGGAKDLASQYTDSEHRAADYPYVADNLTEVTDRNQLASQFDSLQWGAASSTPAVTSRQLCTITADR